MKTRKEFKDAMKRGIKFVFGGAILTEDELYRFPEEDWPIVSEKIYTVDEFHNLYSRPSVVQGKVSSNEQ